MQRFSLPSSRALWAGLFDIAARCEKAITVKKKRAGVKRALGIIFFIIFSDFLGLKKKQFDVLIAVMFDRNYTVKHAYSIPHKIIAKYARHSKYQNGHILIMRGGITSDKRVKNITDCLR